MDAIDSGNLLIFDEMHRVFTNYRAANIPAVMDTIRELHDERQCGIVLCGTDIFKEAIRKEEYLKFMNQMTRRNLYPVQLPAQPPRDDIDLVCAHIGLEPATGKPGAPAESDLAGEENAAPVGAHIGVDPF